MIAATSSDNPLYRVMYPVRHLPLPWYARARRKQGCVGLDWGHRPDSIKRGLGETYYAPQLRTTFLVTSRLAAPRRTINKYTSVILHTKDGRVIVQQAGTFHMFQPETGMGALSGTTAPQKQIAFAFKFHGGGMDKQRPLLAVFNA